MHDAYKCYKLVTPNRGALNVVLTTGGYSIPSVGVYRNPGSLPAKDLKLFHLLISVSGFVDERLTLGDPSPLGLSRPARHPSKTLMGFAHTQV